jgi:hypothetical protein
MIYEIIESDQTGSTIIGYTPNITSTEANTWCKTNDYTDSFSTFYNLQKYSNPPINADAAYAVQLEVDQLVLQGSTIDFVELLEMYHKTIKETNS